MKQILVLGPGCPKCIELYEKTRDVAEAAGCEYELKKVTDITEIVGFGVMMTPALVVDGQVKVTGKVPSKDEIAKMLA